jgi:hypothetical protein
MSKLARTLTLVAMLAVMNLAGMTAVAHARTDNDLPSKAPAQAAAAAAHQSLLAQERYYSSWDYGATTAATSDSRSLASQLARGRLATARYATNLHAAKADGYQIITRMIPDMGWHFLNPDIQGFDTTNPPILVYERHHHTWQLAAFEWVFPTKPATPPLPGATYGSFAAACHYSDGTFVAARVQELCPNHSPQTGARFNFWHPDLVTLHLWLWYPNPAGLYNGTNPLIRPFNHG